MLTQTNSHQFQLENRIPRTNLIVDQNTDNS